MERIWATWYSSFGFIKVFLGCVPGTKTSPSIEVLVEQILLPLIVIIHTAMAEFHVGHCISWEHANPLNLARVIRMQRHEHQHHTRTVEDSSAAGNQHGRRIKHINFGRFWNPISQRASCFSSCLLLSNVLLKPEGNKTKQEKEEEDKGEVGVLLGV
ncbi:hypothetical protein V8G54_028423 [Vigna mungo]|uniref:Uncharacterized protein n=1 Tax=Vigna mungo TaxID=3915 RepID=A0AAQ3MRY3_VIGMU